MKRIRVDFYSPHFHKLIDAAAAGIAVLLAYQLVFDFSVPPSPTLRMWLLVPVFAVGRVALNQLLGCYRMVWKYVGLRDALLLARDYSAFSGILVVAHYTSVESVLRVPLAMVAVEFMLSTALASGVRAARRLQYERGVWSAPTRQPRCRVLLIGAGRIGVATANQLRKEGASRLVLFVDDDTKKLGQVIAGVTVAGTLASLGNVIEEHRIEQILVCIGKPSRELLRHIWGTCELYGASVKMVPTLQDVLNGSAGAMRLKAIEMNDLLGREPLHQTADDDSPGTCYSRKRILVTGAGGSIGSELALQLSKLGPSELILLDKDENGLNDIYLHLDEPARRHATVLVADLRFSERVRGIFAKFRPEIVFHAAAHKHVHLMEANPCEAITNNVTGTRNLVEESIAFSVERFVQVSTDKAVNPTSVMGASKRICEMMVQAQTGKSATLFCCVRFGNVLGSRGSVVPIFQEQIRNGGPLTLTHPDARRFLMTIPEAVTLLIRAGTLANSREIFVLDMGEPVSIRKLAQDMIELSGLSPDRDVRIEIVGLKPGEKVAEALLDDASKLRPTRLEKVQAITTSDFDRAAFAQALRALERCAWEDDSDAVYHHLARLNIGYVSPASARQWPVALRRPASLPVSPSALAPELSWNSSD